jgi:putative SOS response-associated peptidase YedK
MCYNIAYLENKLLKLANRYKEVVQVDLTVEDSTKELPLYYFVSGFSFPALPIITSKSIELFEWGLIPFWVKDEAFAKKIRSQTLNAVGETVFEKPSYKNPIKKNRCLLPVSGFFEWREVNKLKYPYFIKLKDEELFSLGCIYDTWIDKISGETKQTFSIITTEANPLLAEIHNTKKRMPLIIPRKEESKWIDPLLNEKQIKKLIKPLDKANMMAYTVSRDLNNPKSHRNSPFALEEMKYFD